MIKINHTSEQELYKDDFIVKGEYNYDIRFAGVKIWSRNSKVNNVLNDQNFKRGKSDSVGFGK